jgi:hypothetical protein
MAMDDDSDSAATLYPSDDESLPASFVPSPPVRRVNPRYKTTVPVDTDKALLALLLSDERHAPFFRSCSGKEDIFGWPHTTFRKKVQNRRLVLISLQRDNPDRFLNLCHELSVGERTVQPSVAISPPTASSPPTAKPTTSTHLKRPLSTSVPAKLKVSSVMAEFFNNPGKLNFAPVLLSLLASHPQFCPTRQRAHIA